MNNFTAENRTTFKATYKTLCKIFRKPQLTCISLDDSVEIPVELRNKVVYTDVWVVQIRDKNYNKGEWFTAGFIMSMYREFEKRSGAEETIFEEFSCIPQPQIKNFQHFVNKSIAENRADIKQTDWSELEQEQEHY